MPKTLKERWNDILDDVKGGRKTAAKGTEEYMNWLRRDIYDRSHKPER